MFVKSFTRQRKSRQQNLVEFTADVVGGQAAGMDRGFIREVEDVAIGVKTIHLQEVSQRDIEPSRLVMLSADATGHVSAVTEDSITVETQTLVAEAAIEAEVEIQDLTFTADTAGDAGNDISVEYIEAIASLAVQDITYTALVSGPDGENISIEYTDTETAGAEVVSVVGGAISVGIESGVSTATQVLAAINGSAAALALISAAITGTAGDAQVTAAADNLAQAISVDVVSDAITVAIIDGVSTATQIKSAIDGDVGAAALVDVAVSGTGTNAQALQDETFLVGGADALSAGDPANKDFRISALWHKDSRVY